MQSVFFFNIFRGADNKGTRTLVWVRVHTGHVYS